MEAPEWIQKGEAAFGKIMRGMPMLTSRTR
jgi:hypothetical protein